MPPTIVPAGAELPPEFERSVFLAAGAGAWADEAIAQLQGGGFEEGAIFVGDEAPDGGQHILDFHIRHGVGHSSSTLASRNSTATDDSRQPMCNA